MTSKQDFTDEEWTRVRRAPLVAGVAISLADPGGPIEMAKETMATLRSATLPPSQEELLASVAPGHPGNDPAQAEPARRLQAPRRPAGAGGAQGRQ